MTEKNIKRTSCLLLVGAFAASCAAAYREDDGGSADYFRGHESGGGGGGGRKQPLPVILMHKQSLQEDGGFQYAFAADNGLRQGESIRPDGSRTGAYSYTDPDGKEISVKYTAGRDGFRIVQGDHVPKAPVSVVPLQPAATGYGGGGGSSRSRLFGAPGGPGSQFSRGDPSGGGRYESDEAYGPPVAPYKSKHAKLQQHYRVHEDDDGELPGRYEDDGSSAFDGTGDYSSHSPFRAPSALHARPATAGFGDGNSYARKPTTDDEDSKEPHSFGGGYAFEFGGGGTNNGDGAVALADAEF